ncbi:carboxylating nicotinate-nucleotide diphosphorylase [Aurantivibrio infirmus]
MSTLQPGNESISKKYPSKDSRLKKDFAADIPNLKTDRVRVVAFALEEDIGEGDITAQLIPKEQNSTATIITREDCVICGIDWVNEVFKQLDADVEINWKVADGDFAKANSELCQLKGNSRSLLTGERTALNFLQLLSGTATTSRRFAELVKDTEVKILDTRKTIPGLRSAQKYAVRCGGCHNHRIGLYDAFLIKENHIAACDGITNAIKTARTQNPGKTVEVEVENLEELMEALAAKADVIMLDNFSDEELQKSSLLEKGYSKFESSGNLQIKEVSDRLSGIADYASFGSLTKNLTAIDLSMKINVKS